MPFPKPIQHALIIFFLLSGSSYLHAQDYYINFNAGYGLGLPGEKFHKSNSDTSKTLMSKANIGLGGGLQSSASFGFTTRDNWGLDFQLYYQHQFGDSYTSEFLHKSIKPDGSFTYDEYLYMSDFSSWSVGFSPSLKITGDNNTVNPFVSFGPSVYYNYMFITRRTELNGSSRNESTVEYEGRLSYGGIVSAGVEFEVSSDVFFTASIRAAYAYIRPVKSSVTKISDGDLDTWTVRERETEYLDEVERFGPRDDNKPFKDLIFDWDYSSVSLMLGMRWILN